MHREDAVDHQSQVLIPENEGLLLKAERRLVMLLLIVTPINFRLF